MEKYKHSTFDTTFLISGKGATFIGASVISAIINLIFIGNLSNDTIKIGPIAFPPAVLMIAISLTLEASKLLHVIQYNTLNELARKLQDIPAASKIKQVARKWFIGYLMYAALAIIASVNFSVGNLGKTNSATNTKISVAQTYYNSWTEKQNKIDELTKQLATVSSDAKSEWQSQVDLYNKLTPEEQKDKVAAAQWYVYYGKVHAAIGSSETAIKNGGKTLDKYIAYLQKDLDSQLDEANAALEDVKAEAAKADYHSYIALKTAQTTLEADKIANSGSQASFEILAKMLHVNVEGFRTVMLLILSLLIELTIYQTSPKVQINRRMLYQFTAYLPADFNVNKFMDSVDKELISYDMIKTAKKSEVAMNKQDFELERAKKEAEKADLKRKAAEAKLAEKAAKKKEEAEKKAEMPIEQPKKTKKKVVHETVVETKNKSPRKQTKVAQHKTRKATAKVLAPADKKVQSEERDAELQALMDEGKGLL